MNDRIIYKLPSHDGNAIFGKSVGLRKENEYYYENYNITNYVGSFPRPRNFLPYENISHDGIFCEYFEPGNIFNSSLIEKYSKIIDSINFKLKFYNNITLILNKNETVLNIRKSKSDTYILIKEKQTYEVSDDNLNIFFKKHSKWSLKDYENRKKINV